VIDRREDRMRSWKRSRTRIGNVNRNDRDKRRTMAGGRAWDDRNDAAAMAGEACEMAAATETADATKAARRYGAYRHRRSRRNRARRPIQLRD
jgi:hypothetical protein